MIFPPHDLSLNLYQHFYKYRNKQHFINVDRVGIVFIQPVTCIVNWRNNDENNMFT